jgi:hypothetical protein
MFSISRDAINLIEKTADGIKCQHDMENHVIGLSWPVLQDDGAETIRGPQICLFSKKDLNKLNIMYNIAGNEIYSNFEQNEINVARIHELHYDGKYLIYR